MKKLKSLWLDELSTKEVKKAAEEGTVVIFPVGSVEEHGDHLPLCTDSIQAEYIAVEVAKMTDCLVAPSFRHGICNAGRNFPGTISIEFETLRLVARDILAELVRNGFRRIIVLTGHAGSSHMTALRLAAQEIIRKDEKTRIMVLSDYDFAYEMKGKLGLPAEDGHAGAIETSRVMTIRPDLVKGKGVAGKLKTPRFEVVADPERFFENGVDGDPTLASAEKGTKLNEYIIAEVAKLVEELRK
jgi:creatinine amidohydrolase